MQPLEWERLRFGHCRETLDDVYYECSECEGKITEAQKRIALLDGQWVHTYPDKPLKSFHVSQLYSPFCSFESIASEWLIVNASRDIYSIQRFKNEVLGLPFEDDLGLYRDSSDALFNRRERYLADVPLAASVLTMAVDTQDTWLSYTICGWGLDRECWIVRSGRIEGDPSTPGPWDALTQVLYAKYRHESGLQMGITQCLIDTQGHQTTHVNRWLKGKGSLVRGCYGARQPGKPIITKAKKDQHTGLRRWEIGTENAKTDIYQALTVTNPGPLFIHFPFECDEDYFKELYSERKVGSHFKQIGQRRNEKLDELVYNLACYYILLKNYTMEQRADLLQLSIQDLHEPDEPEDETEMVEERIIDQTLPQVEPEPKQPDLPTPERLLTARERYMAKIKGFNTTVQDGFKPLDRW
jgi:phage terminase large subunit GpA-like protein